MQLAAVGSRRANTQYKRKYNRRQETNVNAHFVLKRFLSKQKFVSTVSPNSERANSRCLAGTLADGSPFIFSMFGSDLLNDVTLTPPAAPLPEASPVPVVLSTPSGLSGLRVGQNLTLQSGGELGSNFEVVDATLNLEGGSVESDLEVAGGIVNIRGGSVGSDFRVLNGSEVNISGGSVDTNFETQNGSVVNITGGSVGFNFQVRNGSEVNINAGFVDGFVAVGGSKVNISGGTVGDRITAIGNSEVFVSGGVVDHLISALSGSEVNISGGTVNEGLRVLDGSVLNISGGSVGDTFEARDGSTVNLRGSDFVLDGVALDDLNLGEVFTILDRDVTLSGLLADGSAFSFELDSAPTPAQFGFESGATLTVTLTSQLLLGDANLDGVVNFLDISMFIQILCCGDYQAESDVNEDGIVDFLDISPFVLLLSS